MPHCPPEAQYGLACNGTQAYGVVGSWVIIYGITVGQDVSE